MEYNNRRLKYIIGIIIAIFVVVPIAAFTYSRFFSTVNITVAPANSVITINGKAISSGKHTIGVGEYEVSVSHDGFASQTQSIIVIAGETAQVLVALKSNDPSTANWYETHESDQRLREGISTQLYDQNSLNYTEENEIIKKLPYTEKNNRYTIGYGDCTLYLSSDESGTIGDFCIVIRAEAGFYTAALEYFREKLGDPANYHFQFADYSNPFWPIKVIPEGSVDAG